MNQNNYGLIELVLTAAIVLGVGLWQLRSVSRSIADDKQKSDLGPTDLGPPGHAVGEHPLDEG